MPACYRAPMSRITLETDDALLNYLRSVSLREPELLTRLREETAGLASAVMQISPEQGQFMALLVQIMGARQCLEIGTFTGYSSICVALALPPDGRLVALDRDPDTTGIARRYWAEAAVADRIDLRLGPAAESLATLLDEEGPGGFDFAFIDADKTGYVNYCELILELLRPGGLMLVDNVLWGGSVINPAKQDEDTRAIRAVNEWLHADERIDLSMLPIGDGLTIARKRG